MKVLIACEESQAVCKEFRKRGHEAYSCDILPESGGHPEWHIQDDVLKVIKGDKWDAMIAFPPCTHLALSGAAWFEKKREDGRQREAIKFFMAMLNAPIPMIAVENPAGIISGGKYIREHFPDLAKKYGLPIPFTQKIQPYYFGDEAQKTTCLWLKGLPPLYHNELPNLFDTNITHVGKGEIVEYESGCKMPKWYADAWKLTPNKRSEMRSKTFPGIAKAMAKQWG